MRKHYLTAAAAAVAMAWAGALWADQPGTQVDQSQPETQAQRSAFVFRVADLRGMAVKNSKGEDLGKIEDLVVDTQSGKIRYAALANGGVLGMGEKYFAVPWNSFRLERGAARNRDFLVLNILPDDLKNATGFDKDHWPNMANEQWISQIEHHYTTAEHPTTQTR